MPYFFVYCGSNFDLTFVLVYAIMALEIVEVCSVSCRAASWLTTYLTIDSFGAHGNNGYKTAKGDFLWSVNGCKKPFAAEKAKLMLFGSITSQEHIPQSNSSNTS